MGKTYNKCDSIDYTQKQIRRIIEHYQEMSSIVEVIASCLENVGTKEASRYKGFEHIICILVDLDNAILNLSPQQKKVVTLIKVGYSRNMISSKLSLSLPTVKFHFDAAVLHITTYLNSG